MQTLVADLRAAGTEIWAVSSTNDWVVEEGVRRFGIDPERVLAFQAIIRRAAPCFVRKPRGRDIYAACGQLKRTVEG